MTEGLAGEAKISLTAKGGADRAVPPLPIAQPVRVQLVNGAGVCWEATYDPPAIVNDVGRFKGR
ncbi:MAG: hypothetical protein HY271_00930 [Deltaproteobacteria bacterium]|nr:hypothetical protein [Deltaproteobacteria bacterium]